MEFYASATGRFSISEFLEQVRVRGLICRGLRLELVAAFSIALAVPALAVARENSGW
jgi:hypothetical protein